MKGLNRERFTVVFEGDISKLPFNPLTKENPFGRVVAAAYGDAFDELDRMVIEFDANDPWPATHKTEGESAL